MNKDKELELHGTPKALYDRVRAGLEGETQRAGLPLHVGGGGVLEARWDHRESLDIDVVIPTDNPDAARSALDLAAEQSGGYRVQGPGFDRIEFPDRPQEEHVDVGFSQPTPAKGVEHSTVNGRPAEVLTSTQIMTAKLTHRGLNAPVRDVFDVAVCARIEPRALEAAVNAQDAERRGAITRMYGVISDELKDQASRELRNVRPTFADIVKDPAAAGQKAIADATYQRVQIRCKGKTASITTESRLGEWQRTCGSTAELGKVLEERGLKGFFEAESQPVGQLLESVRSSMERNETVTIVDMGARPAGVQMAAPTPRPRSAQQAFDESRRRETPPRKRNR